MQLSQLANLIEQLSSAVGGSLNLDSLLKTLVRAYPAFSASRICSIFLVNDDRTRAIERASVGYPRSLINEAMYDLRVSPDERGIGLTTWCILTGNKFVANDRSSLESHPAWRGLWDEKHFGVGWRNRSLLILPLRSAGVVHGVLKVENFDLSEPTAKNPQVSTTIAAVDFTKDDEAAFEIVANALALAIHLSEAHQRENRDAVTQVSRELCDLVAGLTGQKSLESILAEIVHTLRNKTRSRSAAIFLTDPPRQKLRLKAHDNYLDDASYDLNARSDAPQIGMTAWVVLNQRRFVARSQHELESHPAYLGKYKGVSYNGDTSCSSWIGIPLMASNECRGILRVEAGGLGGDPRSPVFTEQDENLAEFMAVLTVSALRISELLGQQQVERQRLLNLRFLAGLMRGEDDEQRMVSVFLTGLTHAAGLGFERAIYCIFDRRMWQVTGVMAVGQENQKAAVQFYNNASGLDAVTLEECVQQQESGQHSSDQPLNAAVRDWAIDLAEGSRVRELVERSEASHNPEVEIVDDTGELSEFGVRLRDIDAKAVVISAIPMGNGRCALVVIDNVRTRKQFDDHAVRQSGSFAGEFAAAIEQSHARRAARDADVRAWQSVAHAAAHRLDNYLPFAENALLDAMRLLVDQPHVRARLENCREDMHHCRQLVSEFKQLAAPQSMNLGESKTVEELITWIRDRLELGMATGKISCTVSPAIRQLHIRVDPERIENVFRHLVRNSLAACSTATIRIHAAIASDDELRQSHLPGTHAWVKILVADNGPGIPHGRKEEVFRPFVTFTKGGTGLGLAEVRRTIEAHGGYTDECGAPGQGACVRMFLPLIEFGRNYGSETA